MIWLPPLSLVPGSRSQYSIRLTVQSAHERSNPRSITFLYPDLRLVVCTSFVPQVPQQVKITVDFEFPFAIRGDKLRKVRVHPVTSSDRVQTLMSNPTRCMSPSDQTIQFCETRRVCAFYGNVKSCLRQFPAPSPSFKEVPAKLSLGKTPDFIYIRTLLCNFASRIFDKQHQISFSEQLPVQRQTPREHHQITDRVLPQYQNPLR